MGTVPEWLSKMNDPSFYPHAPSDVEMVQTHISWVFLAGDKVYKIKKPVDFGFLNFTTLDKREHFIREELRLNRRLCPEIYQQVLPIVKRSDGSLCLGDDEGEVVEWVLMMKRMPETGMMKRLITQEELEIRHIDMLVSRLVPFYANAETGGWVDEYGAIDKIKFNIDENFEQTKDFLDTLLDRRQYDEIIRYNEEFFQKNASLFEGRLREGRIREGHGDLYSANICFDEDEGKVYCFDCIEFNKRFRCGDVACDLAFLAMDLDFHGLPWLERHLVSEFSRLSNDAELLCLMDFYKCYRAYVRAKIGCFMANDPGLTKEAREQAARDARDYMALAWRYAGGTSGEKTTLFCFMGLSGTGKSTLAKAFSERMGLEVYNSDVIRKELICGISSDEKRIEPFGEGIYSKEFSRRTYSSLRRHAAKNLLLGRSVCLDATYLDASYRLALIELEDYIDCKVVFILCELEDELVRERLKFREMEGTSPSDGRYEIYLKQKEAFVPFGPEEEDRVIRVNTKSDLETNLNVLLGLLESKGIGHHGN
ncbi:hypothetical protein DBT_2043 [Dissulfuribacter thermophilus]|uniref:Aminoglycoside phosphotransferase domain-containing protein n=1 Tax=Dissulfuribacter thermophilus TaxID=1156395 RepID=A0A1B9F3K2_9BACT|nr:AAA family ATPase [Dissulfuribacter thermophilus]OCC14502.1 hypothetical protein DBT_2043 [Dissulfuribacter thermophilus]